MIRSISAEDMAKSGVNLRAFWPPCMTPRPLSLHHSSTQPKPMTGRVSGSSSAHSSRPVPRTSVMVHGISSDSASRLLTNSTPRSLMFCLSSGVILSSTDIAVSRALGLVVIVLP